MKPNIKDLLLKNIGLKQTIFKNTIWLTIAEVVTRLFGLAVIVGIARILGAAEYGKFAFALSFVSLLAIFSDLGLSEISVRELSKGEEGEKDYPSILSLKILLTIGALILIILSSFFVTKDLTILQAIWVLAFFVSVNGFFNIFIVFLRARQKMEYEALAKIFQALIVTGFVFFVLFVFPSVGNLSWAYLLSNLPVLVSFLFFFHFYIKPLKLSYNKAIWKKFLKNSWPLTFGLMLGWIYGYIDSVMLGHLGLIRETGWYNAAFKISVVTVIPAILITKSFYPALSRISFFAKEVVKKGEETLQRVWSYYMEAIIIFALPIMVGGWVLSSKIIQLLYGLDYVPAGFALQLLLIVAGISFLYYPYGLILVVVNQQKKNFLLIAIGALINIILNLILIKNYTLYGAALATAISSAVVVLLAIEFSRRFAFIKCFNLKLFRTLIFALFSSLIMLFIIKGLLTANFNIILIILVGGFVYSAFLFLLYRFFHQFTPLEI